jgi:hypothetical protein
VDTVIQETQEWKAFFNIAWKGRRIAARANRCGGGLSHAQKTTPIRAYLRATISNALEMP